MAKKKVTAMDQAMNDLLSENLDSSISSNSLILEEFRSQGVLPSETKEDNHEDKLSLKNPIQSLIRFKPNRQKDKAMQAKEKPAASPKSSTVKSVCLDKKITKEDESAMLKVVNKNIHPVKGMTNFHTPIILNQSENLRIAQERNRELEQEIERLRVENEKIFNIENNLMELDFIRDKYQHLQQIYTDSEEQFSEKTKKLNDTVRNQQKKIADLKDQNKSLQDRLSNNIHQIRVRERELENRLELVKNDSHVLIREKDQYILDLKRQIDRIKMDLDRQKERFSEVKKELDHFRGQSRQALRSLNISLGILRGENLSEEEDEELKKA